MQADRVGIFAPLMAEVNTDIQLFEKVKDSDVRAYEVLFKKYYQALVNYANTFLKDIEESEEMVQSVYVKMWTKREDITIHSTVQAYLYRSVNNTCMNRIRHLKVRQQHESEVIHADDSSYEHTAQEVISKELTLQIHLSLQKLPERCRQIFELSRFEGKTYKEIAEELEISVKAVEKQMGKGLQIMRKELKDYLPMILIYLSQNYWPF